MPLIFFETLRVVWHWPQFNLSSRWRLRMFETIQMMCVKWAAMFFFVFHFCQHKPHREQHQTNRLDAQYESIKNLNCVFGLNATMWNQFTSLSEEKIFKNTFSISSLFKIENGDEVTICLICVPLFLLKYENSICSYRMIRQRSAPFSTASEWRLQSTNVWLCSTMKHSAIANAWISKRQLIVWRCRRTVHWSYAVWRTVSFTVFTSKECRFSVCRYIQFNRIEH